MTDKSWFENVKPRHFDLLGFLDVVAGPGLSAKPKKRKLYSISAKQDQADIYLYDDIGDSWDGTTAKLFAEDLKGVASAKVLNIYINSAGGSVFDGVAIYNQLKRHKGRKEVVIDGIAASIASVVAMAGDRITIAENGFLMIHRPWAMAMGDSVEFRKMADELDHIENSILGTYERRTGQEPSIISEMMSQETWMNAEEAVEMGFADEIGSEAKMAARFDLSQFHHVPNDLAAKVDVAKNPPKLELVGGGGGEDTRIIRIDPGVGVSIKDNQFVDDADIPKPQLAGDGGTASNDPPVEAHGAGGSQEPVDLDYRRKIARAKHRHRQAGRM